MSRQPRPPVVLPRRSLPITPVEQLTEPAPDIAEALTESGAATAPEPVVAVPEPVDAPSAPARARARRTGAAKRPASTATVHMQITVAEEHAEFLRGLGRRSRTGAPRALGARMMVAALVAAAVEILEDREVDLRGAAEDPAALVARLRTALEAPDAAS